MEITVGMVGGGISGLALVAATLKKYSLFPFNGKAGGNGVKALSDHVSGAHAVIDEKLTDYGEQFVDLALIQQRQDMILENHEKKLDDGQVRFEKVQDAITQINKNVGILLGRTENRRLSDG